MRKEVLEKGRKLLDIFLINGKPAGEVASDGQVEIFLSIVLKVKPRVACLAPTGYGKSEFISMGVIYRAIFFREDWVIASVKYGTSDIIMKKVIDHLFDSDFLKAQLQMDKVASDRLKHERNKAHLTFREGGSIKVVSLHGADTDAGTAIGEHVPNLVVDESPLLSAEKYLQVIKITEGTGNYDKTFMFELGNAVNRNHFMHNVLLNPEYHKINISLSQAIKEKRLDIRSVDAARDLPFFKEFYECVFPDEDAIDEKGFRTLLTFEQVMEAQKPFKQKLPRFKKLGMDVAGGGDSNVYVKRTDQAAELVGENKSKDLMTNVTEALRLWNEHLIVDKETFIDDIGIGKGVTARLTELKHKINAVTVGKPSEDERFLNLRAEYYWAVKLWIEAGGKLKPHKNWIQLTWIKFKINSDKQIQIKRKEDIKKEHGGISPDFADALMLTFSKYEFVVYHVPDANKLKEKGISSPHGGIGWQ